MSAPVEDSEVVERDSARSGDDKSEVAPERGRLRSFARELARLYGSADPRSLGVFRIALATLLLFDVARRIPDVPYFYSNTGFLTNHFALYRPMSSHLFSVYHAFGDRELVVALMIFQILVNALLLIGWRTKVMQVLAAVLITSLNSRSILLENGGWVVLNLLTVWSLFLPLGKRFSVDALVASWRARREVNVEALNDRSSPKKNHDPVYSLAVTALIAQWVVIYVFNVVHKTGRPWRDGTAVYYFFQQDRMVTDFGAWVRNVIPLEGMKAMSWSALAIESAIAILLVMPWSRHRARLAAFALAVALHGSIDAVVQLGPFSYAMMIMFLALLGPEHWAWLEKKLRARASARVLVLDADDGFSIGVGRLVKRLDSFGLVTFAQGPGAARASDASAPALPSAVTRQLLEETWVVVDPETGEHWTGARALDRLFDALPLPKLTIAWVRIPGVRGAVEALARRAARRRSRWTRLLGLEDVRSDAVDEPPISESSARAFARRLAALASTACVAILLVAETSQVLIENRAVPAALKPKSRPEWMTSLVLFPRLFQGWSMFAPGPPMEDGRVVVDGRTADGRKLDPFTGKEPSWDIQPPGGFRMNQLWGDFHRRIGEQRFRAYVPGVRDMLRTFHVTTGRPEDAMVAFDVWYVSETVPPPGKPRRKARRRKLISHNIVRDPTPFP